MRLVVDFRLLTKQQIQELISFTQSLKIKLCNFKDDYIPDEKYKIIYNFILEFNVLKGLVNYSVPSDATRYLYLKTYGGIYHDMDIIPENPLPLNLPLPLHFRVYIKTTWWNHILLHSPCIILSSPQSRFVEKTLSVLKEMLENNEIRKMIPEYANSLDVTTRKKGATFTTGSAQEIALYHLLYKGKPCIVFSPTFFSEMTLHSDLYDKIQAFVNDGFYSVKHECSYVWDEDGKLLHGIKNKTTLSLVRLSQIIRPLFENTPDTLLIKPGTPHLNSAEDRIVDQIAQIKPTYYGKIVSFSHFINQIDDDLAEDIVAFKLAYRPSQSNQSSMLPLFSLIILMLACLIIYNNYQNSQRVNPKHMIYLLFIFGIASIPLLQLLPIGNNVVKTDEIDNKDIVTFKHLLTKHSFINELGKQNEALAININNQSRPQIIEKLTKVSEIMHSCMQTLMELQIVLREREESDVTSLNLAVLSKFKTMSDEHKIIMQNCQKQWNQTPENQRMKISLFNQ